MKPTPSTLETRRRKAAKTCEDAAADPGCGISPAFLQRWATVAAVASEEEADRVIAADLDADGYSDSRPMLTETCDACGQQVYRAVTVGEEENFDSCTATLCRACLVEALAALDAAP